MKIQILVIIFFIQYFSLQAQTEEKNKRRNILTANILPEITDNNTYESYFLYVSHIRKTYEYFFSPHFSPFVQVGYLGPFAFDMANGENSENIPTHGFSISIGSKCYFNKEKPMGFYIAPQVAYCKMRLNEVQDSTGLYLRITDFRFSLLGGYQYMTSKGFVIDIFTGSGLVHRNYYDTTLSESKSIINITQWGIKPYLGINIGYAF